MNNVNFDVEPMKVSEFKANLEAQKAERIKFVTPCGDILFADSVDLTAISNPIVEINAQLEDESNEADAISTSEVLKEINAHNEPICDTPVDDCFMYLWDDGSRHPVICFSEDSSDKELVVILGHS
ncbi:hypothetical protein [Vibrio sp. D431a]|uniref:hypothetical protein n=1 Tax=Vibrio sp. D431a TaxID=2837388 RepID=UPI00255390EC|nr:hypothetical protein [Vibrio sp. D431a]MDK9789816.1 hypothetical protein [Vibrio sp. D431a]